MKVSYADAYDPQDGIAIVALAGRFPGAPDVETFWENLAAGKETISHFEMDELEPSSPVDMANRREPGYVPARGIVDDIDLLDADFFKMSPREAEVTDPQQRLFLEASWQALERAGYDPDAYEGSIGVYASMSNNTYFLANLYSRPDVLSRSGELPMLGNEKDYLATRVSYKLDLRGPSLNIVTACSSSLVAVCQAVQALTMHQCDMALAGGVSISVPQRRGYLYHEGFITSPDGHCRAFDHRAAGTVFSNGLGVVVLKRLQDALDDGDTIYAVIKGIGLTNDGSGRVSFTAPSVDGQAEAVAMAQALAGIDPDTISYVEAHGTGTALGDPIEIAGLTQAFRLATDEMGYCAIGSVKTNIGHLDAAAGVVGLIKTALALRHRTLPPTLHYEAPNPKLDLASTPFFVNAALTPWRPLRDEPLRAGVSSLGAGGTNAHVVLEEAPSVPAPSEPNRAEQLLVLSARSSEALDRTAERLRDHLAADTETPLADIAYTLQAGRRRFGHRRAVVAASRDEALRLLANGASGGSEEQERQQSPVVFLFPGQGAQRVNMARGLYESEPLFRSQVDECSEVLRGELELDLRSVLYPSDDDAAREAELTQTGLTQPALFVTSLAMAKLWMSWGVEPEAMLGHSLGDFVAACLADVLSRDDALKLVARRARLMQELPEGAMLAVRATVADVEPTLVEGTSIASLNAPNLIVVSGETEAVAAVADELASRGVAAKALATSHAFHSPMMEPVVERFAKVVAEVPLRAPSSRFVSSRTGDWIADAQATDPEYWARQLRDPVRFADAAARLLVDPSRVYLEVGPGRTLSTLMRQQAGAGDVTAIASLADSADWHDDVRSLLTAADRLWSAGGSLDWPGVHGDVPRRRVPLPTYPFERKRYWVDPSALEPGEPALASDLDNASETSAANGRTISTMTDDEHTPNEETPAAAVAHDRKPNLTARLQTIFSELSGMDETALRPDVPFLELGLDSLLLTQAGTAIRKGFGVKIAFRDLLEDASTLDALASRIDAELPPEAAPAPAAGPSAPPPARPLVAAGSESGDLVERVIAQQMELMAQQLEMLRNAGATTPLAGQGPAAAAVSAPTPVDEPRAETSGDGRPAGPFGPYNPPRTAAGGGLLPDQAQALEVFMDRYTRRTAKSKQFAAENRETLADPRSVAGFRPAWKEIVYPIVTERSAGSKLWDIDGNEYVDLTNGFGIIFLGHNPDFVHDALEAQLRSGYEIGPQTALAGDVARMISELTGMERVAFCNTGSEAVTAAIRVARTVSGRDKIATFAGAYHGVFDEVLVRPTKAGGRLRSMPIAPGIPQEMYENVLVLEYGAAESLRLLEQHASELAAVLVEPVQSRRPQLQPVEFLHDVRVITERTETALVFDEVVTGFRTHPGGTQALFGIRADLATYGKVVGGGLPIGIVAGRGAYMDALDGGRWQYGDDSFPEVGVTFFAGTFVRHPLVLAAAKAVLTHLQEQGPELQRTLNLRTAELVDELNLRAKRIGAPVLVTTFSSWFCFEFSPDVPHASLFFAYMRDKGIYLWEGRAGFLTTAHSDDDLARVVSAYDDTLREMQAASFLPGSEPPVAEARLGHDENGRDAWFVPDPERPGKYLQVEEQGAVRG
jgi:acyl transferase domain-containing protein/glutamate-1-semialdehyde aminotransferase